MNPFFSIIIPTYNAEKLLPAALQSILEQSFYDYEVIIMDGFSSDNTFELAHKYAEDHPQIKIFREKDAGIYDAMNKAIQISQGKFLFFLGSDDVFFSDSILSEVYKELHKKTVDVIYGDVFSDRFGGKYDGEFTAEKLYFKNICHQSLFINKSVFHKTGLFNLKYIAHADYDHNIKWFLNKAITKRYIHLIVAKYADGGFSSINGDPIFARDKEKLFLVMRLEKFLLVFILNIVTLSYSNSYLKLSKKLSPKITVILPNYNHSSFLNERMESILNQTYQNFELILLDDCSTDDSVSILNTFKNHPKVSQLIINEENSGSPFKHWQKGIELAKGDYIWIAESDDYCDPSFLEVLIPSLIDESVALAINYYILNYSLYEAHSNNIKSVFNQFTPDLICPQYYQIMTQIKNR